MNDSPIQIDPIMFRQTLALYPTGVTVVASINHGRPVGLSAGSFFSVSLEPPLVGFCVMTTSTTWPTIEQTGRFAVSVLAHDQVDICRQLATKDTEKFRRLRWSPGPVTGSPLIDEAVTHLDCELHQTHRAGDHVIVVGRVRYLAAHRTDAEPLLFCRGGYARHQPL